LVSRKEWISADEKGISLAVRWARAEAVERVASWVDGSAV
jgi:hypothetical protein